MYRQKNFPIHVIFPRNNPDEANKFLAYVRGHLSITRPVSTSTGFM